MQKEIQWPGHVISAEGVRTDPEKTRVIREWPTPVNSQEVQSFMGLAGYYRKFIANFSRIAVPLTDLMQKGAEFKWEERENTAFETLKEKLCSAPVPRPFDPTLETVLETDASQSNKAVAVVLAQIHPDAYLSRRIRRADTRSVQDQEMLAIICALKAYRHYLMDLHVVVLTDHCSLKHFLTQATLNPRQVRWLDLVIEFQLDIRYRSGPENAAADALSRMRHVKTSATECRSSDRPADAHVMGMV